MTQQQAEVNIEAIQSILQPLDLSTQVETGSKIKLNATAATFDDNANRLLKDVTGRLELHAHDATLTISNSWRNTLEGFGWVGPPSPWYEDEYILEIARFDKPEEYPEEKLKQYLKFISLSVLMPGKEKTRTRTVSLEFGTQALVPTVPDMCNAFGIPTPEGKEIKPYNIEEANGSVEVKRRADLKQAFGIGAMILEALDPKTVRKLKKK